MRPSLCAFRAASHPRGRVLAKFFAIFVMVTAALFPCVAAPLVIPGSRDEIQIVTTRGSGTLVSIEVRLGDEVKAGQILGSLDSERELYAYKVAKIRAEDESMVDLAKAETRMRSAELENKREAYKRRRIERPDVDKAQAELDAASARQSIVETNRKIVQLDLERAENELEKRRLRSPIEGVILTIERAKGEKVSEGTTIFTVGSENFVAIKMSLPPAAAKALPLNGVMLVRAVGSNITQIARIAEIGTKPDKDGNIPVRLQTQTPFGVADPFAHPFEILGREQPGDALPETPQLPAATPAPSPPRS